MSPRTKRLIRALIAGAFLAAAPAAAFAAQPVMHTFTAAAAAPTTRDVCHDM